MTAPPALLPLSPWVHRAPILGLVLGAVAAVVDLGLLWLLGIEMRLGGRDVYVAVWLFFCTSFSAFGYVIGALIQARARLRQDAALIRQQMQALQQSQLRLVQAEKLASLGRMAASVAHEVRNPLGVIRSSAGLIGESLPEDGDEVRTACGFIIEEVDRLDGFVRRVLDFSRPVVPERVPVSLSAIAARAARLLDAPFEVELPETDAPRVEADEDLLVRLLLGLLRNAAEAGARRVSIRAGVNESEAWIEVADDGPGVAPEHRAQLFEPFFTTRSQGTGLGLAHGRRVAEAHGGRLELVPGDRGAVFRLCLPLAVQEIA